MATVFSLYCKWVSWGQGGMGGYHIVSVDGDHCIVWGKWTSPQRMSCSFWHNYKQFTLCLFLWECSQRILPFFSPSPGLSEWEDDRLLAAVLAASQQEYIDSLRCCRGPSQGAEGQMWQHFCPPARGDYPICDHSWFLFSGFFAFLLLIYHSVVRVFGVK